MRAYVFSIGESTTDICCELMREYGFDVTLYKDKTTLWEKLERFYTEAQNEDVALRIDADIIPNKNVQEIPRFKPDYPKWECSVGWDWYKQDRGSISVHYMNKLAIELCLSHVEDAKHEIRPETYLWRLPDINLYTSLDWTLSRGIHGYGQSDQRQRIKDLKDARSQEYDWLLVERIESL